MTVFRVRAINPAANARATVWVRANTRHQAEQYVREVYSRHYIESALELTPPEDAEVQEVGV